MRSMSAGPACRQACIDETALAHPRQPDPATSAAFRHAFEREVAAVRLEEPSSREETIAPARERRGGGPRLLEPGWEARSRILDFREGMRRVGAESNPHQCAGRARPARI